MSRDPVVNGINLLDEVLVDFVEDFLCELRRVCCQQLADNFSAEVKVYEASTGEFSCPLLAAVQTGDGLTEGLLVVVKPQPGWVVLPANIHHQVAGGQHCRVPGPHYLRLPVPRQHLQQRAGQGLVTVEGTIVSPDGDLKDKQELSGLSDSEVYLAGSVSGARHDQSPHSLVCRTGEAQVSV